MKIKLVISVLFFSLFVIGNQAFATEGACSDHGGVNSSLTNSFTSVICNDGTHSSTSYSDLKEYKDATKCDAGQVGAYSASRGMLGSSFGEAAFSNCAAINSINTNTNYYTTYIPTNFNIDEAVDREMVKYCATKYGSNSVYDSVKITCGCKSGYGFDKNKMCTSKDILIDIAFQDAYTATMVTLPEYKDVVDAKIIKEVSLMPINANKSFRQIIIDAYSDKIATSTKPTENSTKTPTATTTPVTVRTPLSKTLKIGSSGPEVAILQSMLGIEQSGYFGPKTHEAVVKFQKFNKIPQSGLVGNLTLKVLNK